MRLYLYIHGTPSGWSYFSSAKEDLYVQSFWPNSRILKYDDASMIVKTKVENNSIFCYYTYYRTTKEMSGRPGGYFAITLKTDALFLCFRAIYQILDVVYYSCVYGRLISTGKERKYTDTSFEKFGNEIGSCLSRLLSGATSTFDITYLDDTFIANAGSTITLHPFDLDGFDIAQYKQAEELIVSPNAQTPRERERAEEFQKRIDYIRIEAERKYREKIKMQSSMLAESEFRTDELHQKLNTLKHEYDNCSNKIARLEKDNEWLNAELTRYKTKDELHSTLQTLSAPLSEVVNAFSHMGIQMTAQPIHEKIKLTEHGHPTKRVPPIFKIIVNAIAMILILINTVVIWQLTKHRDKSHKAEIVLPSKEIISDSTSLIITEPYP